MGEDEGGSRAGEATEHELITELTDRKHPLKPSLLPEIRPAEAVLVNDDPDQYRAGDGVAIIPEEIRDAALTERLRHESNKTVLEYTSAGISYVIENLIQREQAVKLWQIRQTQEALSHSLTQIYQRREMGSDEPLSLPIEAIINDCSSEALKAYVRSLPKDEDPDRYEREAGSLQGKAMGLHQAGESQITLTGYELETIKNVLDVNNRLLLKDRLALEERLGQTLANEKDCQEFITRRHRESIEYQRELKELIDLLNQREQAELDNTTQLTGTDLTEERLELYKRWGLEAGKPISETEIVFYLHSDTPMPILTSPTHRPTETTGISTLDILACRRHEDVMGFCQESLQEDKLNAVLCISGEGIPYVCTQQEQEHWYLYGKEQPQRIQYLKDKLSRN